MQPRGRRSPSPPPALVGPCRPAFVLAIVAALAAVPVAAQGSGSLHALVRRSEAIGVRTGVVVLEVRAERVRYRHRAGEAFLPASNQKLLTVAVALRALGTRPDCTLAILATFYLSPRRLINTTVSDLPPKYRSNSRVRVLESEKGEIWLAGNTHLNRSSASCAR